jgi:glycosyltransferase involved in cell wall biosynthesis
MCHAVASDGVHVTLMVDPPIDAPRPTVTSLLAAYGLTPIPTLSIQVLPRARTLASIWFRIRVAMFALRWGQRGIFYSRSKRYTRFVQQLWFCRTPVIQEVHEVDSRQLAERGEDSAQMLLLESKVFSAVRGVVANCPGTSALLASTHQVLPPTLVSHNGAHESRSRASHNDGVGAAVVGSVRQYKGMETVAKAASLCKTPMTVIGASTTQEAHRLGEESGGHLSVELAVPHHLIPDKLTRFRTLVLPLSDGLFGAQLTSPLKLWDYLASGVPIVAADLPSVMEAAPGALYPYTPGDPASLAAAIDLVSRDEDLRRQLLAAATPRTWGTRAAEITEFVAQVLGKP